MAYALDVKDKRILSELYRDARMPTTQIAKNVGLRREVVNYRMSVMEKQGLIEGYFAVMDLSKVGYTLYRILMKYTSITPETESEILEELKRIGSLSFIVETKGQWDMGIIIETKHLLEFKAIYNQVISLLSNKIEAKNTATLLSITHLNPGAIYDENDYLAIKVGDSKKKITIDDVDLKIMEILSNNARTHIVDIAKKLDYTANGIKYKLRRLIDSGLIVGFRPKVNYSMLGYTHYKVMIYLQVYTQEIIHKISRYLVQNPKTVYITDSIGEADLEFELLAKNSIDLFDEINKLRAAFEKIIRKTEYFLIYKEHVINYLPNR